MSPLLRRPHDDERRLDAERVEHRDDERRLVFAVAEAAREDLRAAVRLEAVDPELERDVARLLDDVVVDGADLLAVGLETLGRCSARRRDLVVGDELVLDEAPVPAAHARPTTCTSRRARAREISVHGGCSGSGSIGGTSLPRSGRCAGRRFLGWSFETGPSAAR